MDLQEPLGQPKGKIDLERVFERIRRRWEEIPPSLRPLVGISVGIGGRGRCRGLCGGDLACDLRLHDPHNESCR
jgi:hypothetical protein